MSQKKKTGNNEEDGSNKRDFHGWTTGENNLFEEKKKRVRSREKEKLSVLRHLVFTYFIHPPRGYFLQSTAALT